MRKASPIALVMIFAFLFSCRNAGAVKPGQAAGQCVQRTDYPAGTNNSAHPFSRFKNTCNVAIYMDVTYPGQFKLVGAPGPGVSMTVNWTDDTVKPTHVFACVFPAEPWRTGATFFDPPIFGQTVQCVIP
jgi:hypothetical protein